MTYLQVPGPKQAGVRYVPDLTAPLSHLSCPKQIPENLV